MQLALFTFDALSVDDDCLARAVRAIEKGIDTTTWMLVRVGLLTYCSVCKSNTCVCPCGPLPLIDHEELKVGDTFINVGDAVIHLAENHAFPVGSIFVTKSRTALTCQLTFKMVSRKKSGRIFLKDDLPVAKIEKMVDWRRVLSILEKRSDYQDRLREAHRNSDEVGTFSISEQLDLGSIEP